MKRSCLLTLLIVLISTCSSQWRHNGVAILDTAGNDGYSLPQIAEDGRGGAIICWRDIRNRKDLDIYAQRIDSSGKILWTHHGVPVCTAALNQNYPRMISDGEKGAIIVWEDGRDSVDLRVYAQKISSTGQVQWQENGVKASVLGGLFLR
ncbi:MAG: hypothetical protein V1799_04920, partial [bacterium]